jgi:drug/metabolite transporter (DMT)-like permease
MGKLPVRLTILYLLLLAVFFAFMLFGAVNFDKGHWRDWTVGISVILILSAFITGIMAFIKSKNRSVSLYISIFIISCSILFLLLHSLFIND